MKNQNDSQDFFLVGPLGFEKSIVDEIQQVQPWILGADGRPSPNAIRIENIRKGGLEIKAPWLEGLQLVHHLKTPVRLLYRWKSKKITHVSELKTWLRSSNPQEFIKKDLKLKIQSRKSKLQNEKMIERVFKEDWKMINDESDQTVFVDVYDDQFTLSWDVNGEPLYKRSWAPNKGAAPIRENLAALLIKDLTAGFTSLDLQKFSLLDPMMGSGTFLWEAAGASRLNVSRSFAYQDWKGLPGFLKTEWWKNSLRPTDLIFKDLWGFDQDKKMIEVARMNSSTFTELKEGQNLFLENRDVLVPSKPIGENVLMISNPPYGERLAVKSLENLLQSAVMSYKPLRALFVVPSGTQAHVEGYKFEVARDFLQGGLDVQAVILSVK